MRRWISLGLAVGLVVGACRQQPRDTGPALLSARTLGLVHLERDELPEAEREFRKLITLAPEAALGYANLAIIHLRLGQYQPAEAEIRQALARDSTDPELILLLAKLYELTGRAEAARDTLERALQAHPANARILYGLADLTPSASGAGMRQRQAYLERLVGLLPGNLALRVQLAAAFLELGDGEGALQQLEDLRQLRPEPPREAKPALERAVGLLRAARMAEARVPFGTLRRFLEVTPAYQASLQTVQGPRGNLAGTAVLSVSSREALLQRLGRDSATLRNAIRFVDVTADAGLGGAATPAAKGSALAIGDYDGDGADDLFLATPQGSLLQNGVGGFRERSAAAGGTLPHHAVAAAFGDYDNDGFLDLYAVDAAGQGRLFQNSGRGEFREVIGEAGLAAAAVRKALFADLDHDGDLDLLLATGAGSRVYRNNLDGNFREVTSESGLGVVGPLRDAVFGDLDGDGRSDLVLTGDDSNRVLLRNAGAWRFEDVTVARGLAVRGVSGVVAAGDYDNDGFPDLFVAGTTGAEPALYRNSAAGRFAADRRSSATLRTLRSLAARAATFLDYDNDGFLDLAVVGEPPSDDVRGVFLLHNDGSGRFEDRSNILPADLRSGQALAAWDLGRDGDLDLLLTGTASGSRLVRNDGGNLNLYLKVELRGLRTGSGKNNAFGIGAKLELRAGELYQTRTVTERVTHFGLGRHLKADVLRIEWPNGVPQTIYLPGTDQDVLEEQVLKGSCPFVYAWDGKGFRFVTDVMWRSALGMPVGIMGAGGTAYAPAAASREYLRLPGSLLVARQGRFALQLTEELWETAYVDELKLMVVDHPDSVGVFVNERFVPPTPTSTLRLYPVVRSHPPVAAVDAEGHDVLPLLLAKDDRYVSDLTPARHQGLTKPHALILDLGDVPGGARTLLLLNGWIFPTDASINLALSQAAGTPVLPPSLEVKDAKGRWQTVIPDLGFPSGKGKTVIADLTGKFPTGDHRVRIRTNLQIYWDQAFVAKEVPESAVRLTTLSAVAAGVHPRGFSRGYRKGGRYGPHWFDYDSTTTEPRWRPIEGAFTRFGDVLPLISEADDRYIIMAPGDETTVEFDAATAPPLPPAWSRDFLIYTVGWIKDADLNTAHGNTVEPLPFHGMTRYPYDASEAFPGDAVHRRFVTTYNTRRLTRTWNHARKLPPAPAARSRSTAGFSPAARGRTRDNPETVRRPTNPR